MQFPVLCAVVLSLEGVQSSMKRDVYFPYWMQGIVGDVRWLMSYSDSVVSLKWRDRRLARWRFAGELPTWYFSCLSRSEWKEWVMSVLGKVRAVEGRPGGVAPAADEAFAKKFPAVWEYLTAPAYPDGEARDLSALTVFWEEGVCKMVLNDRDNERSMWASAPTFQECLLSLNKRLSGADEPWRRSPARKGKPSQSGRK